MSSVPAALLDGETLPPELAQPCSFGNLAYYEPRIDLARISASYESIRELRGNAAADEFARNVREKARYYHSQAANLRNELSSAEVRSMTPSDRDELCARRYSDARMNSAQSDLKQGDLLSSVVDRGTVSRYKNNQYSFCRIDENGSVTRNEVWISPEAPSSGDDRLLTDRGLQNSEKTSRFYTPAGNPDTVGILVIRGQQVGYQFEVSDPDSARMRSGDIHHIPFGYSSGGKREMQLALRQEYLSEQIKIAENTTGRKVSESRETQAQLKAAINSDTLGPANEQAYQITHSQHLREFTRHSFNHPEGAYKPKFYDTEVKLRLSEARKAEEKLSTKGPEGQSPNHTRGPPKKEAGLNNVERTEKDKVIASMRASVSKKAEQKSQGSTKKIR